MLSTASRVSDNVLSIRFSPGGLSFWTGGREERFMPLRDGLSLRAAVSECLKRVGGRGDFERVRLFLDVPTVVVPAEVFDPGQAADYLDINNLPFDEALWADAGAGVVAVMACDSTVLDVFRGVFGGVLEVHSPFELVLEDGQTAIYLTGSRAYIATWQDGRLVFCDSLPYSAAADLVYFALKLFPSRARIYICGLGFRAAAAALGKNFSVRCV